MKKNLRNVSEKRENMTMNSVNSKKNNELVNNLCDLPA